MIKPAIRHPRGTIGRLPAELRLKINLKLDDNVPATEIAEWLKAEHPAELEAVGAGDGLARNINNWRPGGYEEWRTRQERLEEMRLRQEFALDLAGLNGNQDCLQQAALIMAASHLFETLEDFDITALKNKLADHPELYGMMIDAITKLSRAGLGERKLQLEFTKYRDKVAAQKEKLEHELGKAKSGGLTPDVIAQMEEALNLL